MTVSTTNRCASQLPRPSGNSALEERRRIEMFRRFAEAPTPQAREELIREFMPFARRLAARYALRAEPFDDLAQVAYLGLVKAIDAFDPERGVPFTGFAVPTILGELRRHFRDRVWTLRLPRGLQELTARIDRATEKLSAELGRTPSVNDLARELEVSPEDVLEGIEGDRARRADSLDAPRTNGTGDDAVFLLDTLSEQEPGFDRVEAQSTVDGAGLSEREREILRLRFVEGLSQSRIGERLFVSQMQVSRESRRALGKLLAAVQGEPGKVREGRTRKRRTGGDRS